LEVIVVNNFSILTASIKHHIFEIDNVLDDEQLNLSQHLLACITVAPASLRFNWILVPKTLEI